MATDNDTDDNERIGWFAPDTDDNRWGRILAILEAEGYEWSEERGCQLLSRRSFEIYREQDTGK